MNGRNGPLSPVSVGGDSQWSGISKYDTDSQFSQNPNSRGQLASPPISSGSNSTMNGFPPRGSSTANGNPSPPSSIARSSIGTGLYAQSESGRSRKDEQFEDLLSNHYVSLKRYLAASLRDANGNARPNRARDKLLRLSPVQFQELSTDVYDELQRRQQGSRRGPNGAPPDNTPPYLLPKDSFHPKRNQARQKLSTLPPPRFRDLATDVFYELERRFPNFAEGNIKRIDSPGSARGPPSRKGSGTPINGMPPRSMRRPSDASSIAYSMRSESRGPRGMNGSANIPPSPGVPSGDFGRPTPKTFQSNTLVPNKSTMVEDDETGGEDNDDDDGDDAFGLEGAAMKRESKKSSAGGSETDKKLIDDYQSQVAELREKLDAMEDNLRQKDDELNNALDRERSQATAVNVEKKELTDLRDRLEAQLADAQNLNESLQSELDRMRSSQISMERELRAQIEELRVSAGSARDVDPGLEQENQELRSELREQQRVTDEVRNEAQDFLREMRMLSERSTQSYEREEQLSLTVDRLEAEVQDWRNRYARTKTQLRGMRASSIGLQIGQTAGNLGKDSSFTSPDGTVKDVHITKFQISIDELLKTSRTGEPARVIEFMKSVVVSVRRITQDIDDAPASKEDLAQQQAKLKSRVSATANNLITASKNFASAGGLSPVSLLDAAASHLTSAVVELVRTVKIRPTPAGELGDDDDGNLEPSDTTGFFPVRNPLPLNGQQQGNSIPPAFQGLRNARMSANSSMYSPMNSPQETMRPVSSGKGSWAERQSISRGQQNGAIFMNGNKGLPATPMGVGFGIRTQDSDIEELKIYLEDQTALLVQNIQSLVSSIRSEAGITAIETQINSIADVIGTVVEATENAMSSSPSLRNQSNSIVMKLASLKTRMLEAGQTGRTIADEGRDDEEGDRQWRDWNKSLPPIAFEIARETKELVLRVDIMDGDENRGGDDDFS